jgi:hypothetical protein
MQCSDCHLWILKRITVYDDGTEIANFTAPDGVGHCNVLDINTKQEFGCIHFIADLSASSHVEKEMKSGTPWQNFRMIICPTCSGKPGLSSGSRCQCAGTGNVRQYDDGYVADEQKRAHPKEEELAAAPKPNPGTVLAPIDKGSDAIVQSGSL